MTHPHIAANKAACTCCFVLSSVLLSFLETLQLADGQTLAPFLADTAACGSAGSSGSS